MTNWKIQLLDNEGRARDLDDPRLTLDARLNLLRAAGLPRENIRLIEDPTDAAPGEKPLSWQRRLENLERQVADLRTVDQNQGRILREHLSLIGRVESAVADHGRRLDAVAKALKTAHEIFRGVLR